MNSFKSRDMIPSIIGKVYNLIYLIHYQATLLFVHIMCKLLCHIIQYETVQLQTPRQGFVLPQENVLNKLGRSQQYEASCQIWHVLAVLFLLSYLTLNVYTNHVILESWSLLTQGGMILPVLVEFFYLINKWQSSTNISHDERRKKYIKEA